MHFDRLAAFALLAALATSPCAPGQGSNIPLRTTRVMVGLTWPTHLAFAPGDSSRIYVTEKPGRVRVYDLASDTLLPEPMLDIDPLVGGGIGNVSEQGLLGIAFHPQFQSNGYVYLNYTANNWATVVVRYVATSPVTLDPDSAQVVITYAQPAPNHNGGWLAFDAEGYLLISSGDGSAANDPGNLAQQTVNQKLGKILRIDVDADDFPDDPSRNYAIVASNPFVGLAGDDEILHYGLRNPWRCSLDRRTGDLYIGDVGQNAREEVNVAPAGMTGLNFGWRCMEGNLCTGLGGCECNSPELTMPIHVYDRGPTGGTCVIGGHVYRGCAIPEADGTFFFADYGSNRYWSFRWDGNQVTEFAVQTSKFTPTIEGHTIANVVSFAEDHDGELYFIRHHLNSNMSAIYKVIRDPLATPLPDCNGNGVADTCDIARGDSLDLNGNGIPDECEPVPGDLNGDGIVDGADLGIMLGAWGECDGCDADLNGDGTVDGGDLGVLLGNWT